MEEEEIDLKELFSMFWKRKWLIILILIIFAVLGFFYTNNLVTPLYKSSTTLVMVQSSNSSNNKDVTDVNEISISTTDLTLNSKLVEDYKEIALSKTVLKKVIDNLSLDMSVAELEKSVDITSSSDTEIIDIAVSNKDRELACTLANEIQKVSVEISESLYNINNIRVLDVAEVAEEPYNISYVKNIAIFGFIGLVLVCGYILILNMLDTTIKNEEEITRMDLPVLAAIPYINEQTKISIQKNYEKSVEVKKLMNVIDEEDEDNIESL